MVYSVMELRSIIGPVLRYHGIHRAVLFGSYATGCVTGDSDIDLLVDSGLCGLRFFGLQYDIQEALGKEVD